jgi:hypothetical protein
MSESLLPEVGLKRLLVSVAMTMLVLLGTAPVSIAQDDVAAFRDLATGADFRLRVAAALALGRSRHPGARSALEKALSDPHPAVRAAASAALGQLGDGAAMGALRQAHARESTPSVKAQFESTMRKLAGGGSAPAAVGRAKFLVALGRIDIRSGVSATGFTSANLKATTRSKLSQVPGVEMLAEGADAGVASKSRGLPTFTLDGSLTKLAKNASSGGVSYSARVEFLIRKMPEQAIKGTMSGAAQAEADSREIRGPRELEQLQSDAVTAAVESALRGAPPALEAAMR